MGEYEALAVITRWAQTLQSLTAEANGTVGSPGPPVVSSATNAISRKIPKGNLASKTPSYSRDEDMLVKTARSRKSKNGYVHRAAADVVLTVAECLSEWRPSRKLMTGEQLLDAFAKRKGAVVSYQVYAALGWFTQIGLVRRHGRSGYSVPQASTIVADVRKAWDALKHG
jgi:hypothetical protein